jgi:hypothetical protein
MVLRPIYKPPCDVFITPLIRGLILTNKRATRGKRGGFQNVVRVVRQPPLLSAPYMFLIYES